MIEFMTDYWGIVIFVSFLLGVVVGRIIERENSKHEDYSRAEDDVGY